MYQIALEIITGDITATYVTISSITQPQGNSGYAYIWANKAATFTLVRITLADGTLTDMTISGTAPDNDAANSLAFDSSGNLYILNNNSTNVKKYTISGTTATYDSAITLSTIAFNSNGAPFMIIENNNFVYSTSSIAYQRDNSSGTAQDTLAFDSSSSSPTLNNVFKNNNKWYGFWFIETEAGDEITEIRPFKWI